ncbi:structural constituent of chitin-based cuticle [Nesidiocoris tenuis]|uniref:Structural constituent of chitin-based cuticle n=1 Tax=Nesidiocoris tenuis TaxID=355587 RepID=A0ABN7A9C3_9HEMI|nr:structural constituent of chitin-based cuticle [Nesidiocoris tenuis]
MKTLVVISALVACCAASGSWGYSTIDAGLWGGSLIGAPAPLLAARTIAAPGIYASSPLLAARTIAAPGVYASSPLLAAPSVYASAPLLAARTVAAAPSVIAAPAPAIVAPAPAVVASAPVITKYHSQDELGQASYGHSEPLQTHNAVQDAHGNKVGSFSYLNPHDGQVHRTDYVADALGYRVAANDLPIDTPEVAIAKAAHLNAHAVESVRAKRSILAAPAVYETPASTSPLATHVIAAPSILAPAPLLAARSAVIAAPAPLVAAAPAPLLAAAPALRAATLTTVVNNPGHAVSYRVD